MIRRRASAIPLILCIDAEPDARAPAPDDPVPWHGFERTVELFERRRPQLERATGAPVRLSWYLRMDAQVERIYGTPTWGATTYAREIDRLRELGDSIGLHPHAWRWRPSSGWIIDHGDQGWVDHCVRMSFEAFRDHFGGTCEVHRFGDHFMTNATVALLEELGVRIDLTTEPGEPEVRTLDHSVDFTGSLPDLTVVPRAPYRPSAGDYRRPGTGADRRSLWMIPLSATPDDPPAVVAADVDPGRLRPGPPSRLARASARRRRLEHCLPGPDHRLLAMWKDWRDPAAFWDTALRSLGDLPWPYLALAMRSDAALGPAPGAVDFDLVLGHLVEHPELARCFRFTTPAEALRLLGLAGGPFRRSA